MENENVEKEKPKRNPFLYSTVAMAILLVVVISLNLNNATGMVTNVMSKDDIGSKVIDYINNNLVQPGTSASLISVEETNGIYKIMTSYLGQQIPVYATMDGALLILPNGVIDMTEKIQTQHEQQTEFNAPDREKPNVKFFVMSFCPFGNQAEQGLEPVFRLLNDKVEWEPHYVIYSDYGTGYPDYCLDKENKYCSMHGIQELNQDVRELCVWKYYPASKWWDFVIDINKECNSRNADTCWEPIARRHGIDVDKIKNCQENEAETLLEREVKLNQQYGVRGSPTVFINDLEYRGSRSPDAYKNAICSGFITEPDECSQELSSTSSSSGQC